MRKKQKQSPTSGRPDWYQQADQQGLLEQEKKAKKAMGNPLDSHDLDQLKNYKKNLEKNAEAQKQNQKAQAMAQAKEAENNTHWFDLAEKNGYLD